MGLRDAICHSLFVINIRPSLAVPLYLELNAFTPYLFLSWRSRLRSCPTFDPADFVDDDFQARKTQSAAGSASGQPARCATREEVELRRVSDTQQKLIELEARPGGVGTRTFRARRKPAGARWNFKPVARQEMIHNLTRGLGLLEEAEFTAQARDAEQMAKTIADFRDVLTKIEMVREETWTKDNFSVELTRALTAIENGRMEWNTARLKFPVLTERKSHGRRHAGRGPFGRSTPDQQPQFLANCANWGFGVDVAAGADCARGIGRCLSRFCWERRTVSSLAWHGSRKSQT